MINYTRPKPLSNEEKERSKELAERTTYFNQIDEFEKTIEAAEATMPLLPRMKVAVPWLASSAIYDEYFRYAVICTNLAVAYECTGQAEKAEEAYQKSMGIYYGLMANHTTLECAERFDDCLYSMANFYQDRKQYEVAVDAHLYAIPTCEKGCKRFPEKFNKRLMDHYCAMEVCLAELNNKKKADECHAKAEEIQERINNSNQTNMSLIHITMNGVTCEAAPNHLKSAIESVTFPVSFLSCEDEGLNVRRFHYSLRTIKEIGDRPIENTYVEKIWPTDFMIRHCSFVNGRAPIKPSELRVDACRLVEDLPAEGTVLVWSREASERALAGLAAEYPDLNEPLQSIIDRMVEMKPWFENCIVWSPLKYRLKLDTTMAHFYPEQPEIVLLNHQQRSFALATLFKMAFRINKNIAEHNEDIDE